MDKMPVYLPDSPHLPVSPYLELSCVHKNIELCKDEHSVINFQILSHSSSFLLPEVH